MLNSKLGTKELQEGVMEKVKTKSRLVESIFLGEKLEPWDCSNEQGDLKQPKGKEKVILKGRKKQME